jgi:hypothetical protein
LPKETNMTTEQKMLAALLPLGIIACQTFAPYYRTEFTDKRGEMSIAKPDAIFHIVDDPEPVMFEFKSALLNSKTFKEAARNKLAGQYKHRFQRDCSHLDHSELSGALWRAGHYKDCLNHAWNHSAYKHQLISNSLPDGKYVLVFDDKIFHKEDEDTIKEFSSYAKKGIFCLPVSGVSDFINSL